MGTLRKYLYLDTDIVPRIQADDDLAVFSKITLSGDGGVALDVQSQEITGLPASPAGSSSAVSKAYVDSFVQGATWKDPAQVLKMVDDSLVTSPALGAGDAGKAYVVGGTGGAWSGFAVGDIVEWTGTAWTLILAGSGGEPIDGVRVVVITSGAAGSFAGEGNGIGTYDATGNSWSFYDPSEGDALLIVGDGSIYENLGYTYNGTTWIQFTGIGQITAGDGLSKDGNTLNVNAGDGITFVTDRVTIDLATNPGLALTGTTPDAELEWFPNTNKGLAKDASGAYIKIPATNEGLFFDGSGQLDVLLRSGFGILKDNDDGLYINIDDTPDTLDVDGSGLKVVGLPSLFKVNDVATSANVTAANLNTLTGGATSIADTLHAHTYVKRLQEGLVTGEALVKADPVSWSATANQLAKGDAANDADSRVIGVSDNAYSASATATIIRKGILTGALTGATPNTPYYLANGGGITTTPPTGSGNNLVRIGYAVNSTDLDVNIEVVGRRP